MRASTVMPRFVTAAASRSIVSAGPKLLAEMISPAGVMRYLIALGKPRGYRRRVLAATAAIR
jgi:hypothetical protein